jgi:hypothetical protein
MDLRDREYVVTRDRTRNGESFIGTYQDLRCDVSDGSRDWSTRHRVQYFNCRVPSQNAHGPTARVASQIRPNDVTTFHQGGVVSRARRAAAAMIASS